MSMTKKDNRIIVAAIIFPILLVFAVFLFRPPPTSYIDELEMVPETVYLHCHISSSFDSSLLSYIPDNYLSTEYIADILTYGPIGISITGIDFLSFLPQYLILTRSMDMNDMETCFISFHGDSTASAIPAEGRIDILDAGGGGIASITEKDGWTAVFTGYGSSAAAGRWISLEKENSLAADSIICLLADSPTDFSIIATNTAISFLNLIPATFLSYSERYILESLNSYTRELAVHAASFNLSMPQDSETFEISLFIGHRNCTKTVFSCELDRATFPPDSLLNLIPYSNDRIR